MLDALHNLINWIPLGLPAFVLVITTIVFFHELGHFSVARLLGVRVETFSIGFGPAIASWDDRKGTRWKISWIPLGGFVKFFGDADASSAPDRALAQEMTAQERAVAFPFKPLYQRALIVLAGPVANFVLAIAIFAGLFAAVGVPAPSTLIGSVTPHSAAAMAGIRPGDRIVAINGTAMTQFDEMRAAIQKGKDKPLAVKIDRGGKVLALAVTPRKFEADNLLGDKVSVFGLGVGPSDDPHSYIYTRIPPVEALKLGVGQTWGIIDLNLTYVGRLFAGRSSPSHLAGPLGIAGITKKQAANGPYDLVWLIAVLSVSIGLVNLFPIPVLDGGHLLYYGFEAILGRPLGAKAQEVGFRLGLAVILGLFLFVTWNDLVRPSLF